MFQDLEDLVYDNAYRQAEAGDQDVILLYDGDRVLAREDKGNLELPRLGRLFGRVDEALRPDPQVFPKADPDAAGEGTVPRYAFTLGADRYFLADAPALGLSGAAPAGLAWVPSRDYRGMGPKGPVFAAAVGESLHRWYRANRFCGACGGRMGHSQTERAMVCPACGLTVYPKISPAVIAAVTDGDRLLLTKYQGRAFRRYALVAGFHEIGETIEDTVRREVFEETGLRVKEIRYYKSQPWVFTDSLLLGFFCVLEGSDRITLQRSELSEAGWFHRSEVPADHSGISLTGEMIEVFRAGGPWEK